MTKTYLLLGFFKIDYEKRYTSNIYYTRTELQIKKFRYITPTLNYITPADIQN